LKVYLLHFVLEEEKELDRDVVSERLRDDVVCLYMIK